MTIKIFNRPTNNRQRETVSYQADPETGELKMIRILAAPVADPKNIAVDFLQENKGRLPYFRIASKYHNGTAIDVQSDAQDLIESLERGGFDFEIEGGISVAELGEEMGHGDMLSFAKNIVRKLKNENSILDDRDADRIRAEFKNRRRR